MICMTSTSQLDLFTSPGASTSEEFFTRKRTWSAAKHRIVLRSLQAFCYNLGGAAPQKHPTLNYVDGFAGAGSYDAGIGIEQFIKGSSFWKRYSANFSDKDGSPLIALKMAQLFREENRVHLKCFFSEAKKENYDKLRKKCTEVGPGLEYEIFGPQTFSTALPEILNKLHNRPTFFFLDTFGVKGVTFPEIQRIARYVSKNKGELFLLFHNRQVARHGGQSTARSSDTRISKASETYSKNLTLLLGDDSEHHWKLMWKQFKEKNQGQAFENWALNFFVDKLQRETLFNGVSSFPIRENYSDTRPQYHIITCSNYPKKALGEFINEFVFKEDELLFWGIDKSGSSIKFLTKAWDKEIEKRVDKSQPLIEQWLTTNCQSWKIIDDVLAEMVIDLILSTKEVGFLGKPIYRQVIYSLCTSNFLEFNNPGRQGNPVGSSRIRARSASLL